MSNAPRSIPPTKAPAGKGGSRTPLFIVLGLVAVVLVALVVAVVAGGDDDPATVSTADGAAVVPTGADTSPTQAVTITGDPLPGYDGTSPDPALGATPPTLTGATFDGSAVTVTPGDGKRKLVVVVAHWCPHCQAEVPKIVEWASEGKLDGVDVVAISTSVDPGSGNFPPQDWLAEEGWPFPVLADSGTQSGAIAYGTQSFPYMVSIDAEGKVTGRASGELSESDFTALVATSA